MMRESVRVDHSLLAGVSLALVLVSSGATPSTAAATNEARLGTAEAGFGNVAVSRTRKSQATVTISAPNRAHAGKPLRIRGVVRPGGQGIRLVLQRATDRDSGWIGLDSTKTSKPSKYAFTTDALAGTYVYRTVAFERGRRLAASRSVTVHSKGKFVRAEVRRQVQTLSGRSVASITGDPRGARTVRLKKKAQLPRNGRLIMIKPGGAIRSGDAGKVGAVKRTQRSFVLTPVPATEIYSDLSASFDTSLAEPEPSQTLTNRDRGERSLSASAPEFACNGTLSLDNRAVRVDLSSVRVQFAMDLAKQQLSISSTGKPSIFGGADALQGVSGTCSLFYPVTQKPIGYTGFVFRVGPVVQLTVSASGRVQMGMRLDLPYTAGVSVDRSQVSFTRGGRYTFTPTISAESEAGLSAGLAMQIELTWIRLAALQGTIGPEIKGSLKPTNGNRLCATVEGNVVTDLTANAARIAKNWDFQIAGRAWPLGNFYDDCNVSGGGGPLPPETGTTGLTPVSGPAGTVALLRVLCPSTPTTFSVLRYRLPGEDFSVVYNTADRGTVGRFGQFMQVPFSSPVGTRWTPDVECRLYQEPPETHDFEDPAYYTVVSHPQLSFLVTGPPILLGVDPPTAAVGQKITVSDGGGCPPSPYPGQSSIVIYEPGYAPFRTRTIPIGADGRWGPISLTVGPDLLQSSLLHVECTSKDGAYYGYPDVHLAARS